MHAFHNQILMKIINNLLGIQNKISTIKLQIRHPPYHGVQPNGFSHFNNTKHEEPSSFCQNKKTVLQRLWCTYWVQTLLRKGENEASMLHLYRPCDSFDHQWLVAMIVLGWSEVWVTSLPAWITYVIFYSSNTIASHSNIWMLILSVRCWSFKILLFKILIG
jgi:hypothetical protein